MKYGERLKYARNLKKWSQNRLAIESGVGQGTISKIERGDQEASTYDIALAKSLNISAEWLSKKEGSIERFDTHKASSISEKSAHIYTNVENGPEITGRVPLINWVQAGNWAEIIDNNQPGEAEDWLLTTANVSKHAFALRVKGDSMTASHGISIPENSIVIIDPDRHCDNGSIVVARLNDSMEATLKKLVIDGHQKFLKPLNPAYPIIPINGNCEIIGKAVRVEFEL